MDISEPDFDRLLDTLYMGCRDISHWQIFGEQVKSHIGGSACEISIYYPNSGELNLLSLPYLSDAQTNTYLNEMIKINPRIPLITNKPDDFHVFSDHFSYDIKELKRCDFIDWSRSELGLQFLSGNFFSLENNNIFAFIIHRSIKEGLVDESGLKLLRRLFPHIRRAANLSELTSREPAKSKRYSQILDNSPYGIAFLNRSVTVIEINKLAQYYLNSSKELFITGNGQLGTTMSSNGKVGKFIKSLKSLSNGSSSKATSILLTFPCGKKPIRLIAIPVSALKGESNLYHHTPTSALYFFDKGYIAALDGFERLCVNLGLTNREAQIAALLYRGDQPKAISNELQIAESTVRVFIKNIHRKLGINRQTELIRLLAEVRAVWF